MEAYLDNSATTRPFDSVREIMSETMDLDYGNPSSMHKKGFEAERYIKESRQKIAASLKASEKEIIFTSGGTESNNMALIGAAMANRRRGNHLITTSVEHASVSNVMAFLEEQGFHITYLPVDSQGTVSLEALKAALTRETILVSMMYVNNEIGSVQPVAEAAKLIHAFDKEIIFHVDAIQAYGKYRIRPGRMGIDLMSVSGHKIHGPKGTGFLYVRDKVKIKPIIWGGGQQDNMRSGTENVPGIAGLGKAVEEIYKDHKDKIARMYHMKEILVEALTGEGGPGGLIINGQPLKDGAPHIVSVSFPGIRSEVLLHALEDKGVYVSAGSACSSNHPAISRTLLAIGADKSQLDSTLRFSFGAFTTEEEVRYAADCVRKLVPGLREFYRH